MINDPQAVLDAMKGTHEAVATAESAGEAPIVQPADAG